MNIVVAFNAFKGSMSPIQAGKSFIKGWKMRRMEDKIIHFPVADGGDGTLEVWKYHFGGQIEYIEAFDPLMRPVKVPVIFRENTAMFAMSDVSGLALLEPAERNARVTTTYGMGKVIKEIIERDIKNIVISVGGSATVDGGIGLLMALSENLIKFKRSVSSYTGDMLLQVEDLADVSFPIYNLNITVLADVDNPLIGRQGAVYVYGPQKGLSKTDLQMFDRALEKWGLLVQEKTGVQIIDTPFYGAAGGVIVAFHLIGNVKVVSGIEYFLEKANFPEKVKDASILFTGEGSIDRQTFMGKAPYGVSVRFKKITGGKVVAIGGKVDYQAINWNVFDVALSMVSGPISVSKAIASGNTMIEKIAYSLAGIF